MLGGHAELVLDLGGAQIPFLDEAGLFHHLAGIAQEFLPVRREQNPLVGALEDGDAQFAFQFLDGGGQAGLGQIQPLGRLADGTGFGHRHHVF